VSKNFWHDIETGLDIPEIVNVVVEIPKGSQNKYEYDKKNNMMKLDRVLFSPFHYPGDYGIIPQTLSDDGDPLDALVLVTNPTYPGILIECRPLGLLRLTDQGQSDDKIICVAINDPRYLNTKDIKDIESHNLKEMAHFFQVYKDLEGKKVEVLGWESAETAKTVIMDAVKNYKKILKKY
jgi:inorganic pyrophosphatase